MRRQQRGLRDGLLAAIGLATVTLLAFPPTAAGASSALPSFYSVPAGVSSKAPGSLLKSEKIAAPGLDGTAYRVMYVSTDEQGKSVPVTGVVLVPKAVAPSGGYPVVTWAHGTNGMADQCAPSLAPFSTDLSEPIANQLLAQGWAITASDYQGEGTPPGELPYLVGDLSGRNTIDIVSAARHLAVAHTSTTYIVWGHSEGGQPAMFAWHLGPSYGSKNGLHMVGTVAGAPPSQFAYIYDALQTSPYRFYLFMAAAGYNIAYGNRAAPLTAVLTRTAMGLLPDLKKGCFNYLESTLDKYSMAQLVKTNPFNLSSWKVLLTKNDPASFSANDIPLLIYQGGADEQIPVVSTQLLAQHLCSQGQDLERWIYPGQSHAGVVPVAAPDLVHWMADRFAGDPDPDPYQPTGEAGVQVTTCPS